MEYEPLGTGLRSRFSLAMEMTKAPREAFVRRTLQLRRRAPGATRYPGTGSKLNRCGTERKAPPSQISSSPRFVVSYSLYL